MGQLATQGQQGIQGPVGPIGPRGLTGPQGVKGDTGPTGPKGDIGPQGAVGPKGDTGPQGAIGPKGDIGPQGPKGDTGPQGPVGPAGTFNPDTMKGMTMWCATGEVCNVPSGKSVNIPGSTILQFGADQTKEANAGKIGYKVFSQGLDIVGAGTTQEPRQITMWDTVNVKGVVTAKDFMKGDQSVLVGTDLVNYMSKPDFDKWSSDADKRYATQFQLDTTFQNFVPKIEGATKADLNNYSTKTETDSKIAGVISQADSKYATKAESDSKYATLNQFDTTFQSFVPRVEADNKYATKTQIANYYTKAETDTKLSGWASENTATEVSKKTMWCADGQICELPSTTQNVKVGTASMEFGSGLNKEINAGKIVYGAFGQSNKLSIVGGGASNQSRTVKVWDNLEVDKLNTPGLTGPFNFRLYDKMDGQRCMDSNAWSGNGDEVCSDSRSQLFYYSPLTGQIQAVSNNQCLTQTGGQWNWQACNADDPNQQFSKKEHLVQWRNGECLDLGNSNHKAQCDSNNANQKMVWKYKQQ